MWSTEGGLWKRGIGRVAGVDEVGRGPLAGPVVAAAVILPGPADPGHRKVKKALAGIRDSKQLTEGARERYADLVREHAVAFGVGQRDVAAIDSLNILQASLAAMSDALDELTADGCTLAPDFVLVDGNMAIPNLGIEQLPIVDGDALCASIAAASVLAKVHRDKLMVELHATYDAYGFDRNKGYGTPAHLAALAAHGPCPEHRRSFKPVQEALSRHLSASS
jgi:ribonuclease HII